MAGDAVVGALRVVLGMDTASYEDGVKKAQQSTENFAKDIGKAAAGVSAAFLVITGAILVGIQHTIDKMDAMAKAAQKVGVPVEMLSGMKLAADIAGVGITGLTDAFTRLSKNATEAAAKPMSQAANAFRAVGVQAKDSNGNVKSAGDLFLEIADKFSGLKDGAAKATLAMALFGESGAKLIPLLNQGRSGIQGMIEEAAKLGIVISDQTAKSAVEFNNTLTRLGAAKDALFIKISAQLLPALLKLSEIFLQNAKDADVATIAANKIGDAVLGMTQFFMDGRIFVTGFGKELKALNEVMLAPWGQITEKWTAFKDTMKETDRQRAELAAKFESFDPFGTFDAVVIPPLKKLNDGLADVNLKALGGKTAFDQFINSTKQSTAAVNADAQAVGSLAGFRESLRVIMQGEQVAIANRLVLGDKEKQQLLDTATAAGDAALKLQGINLVFQNLDPLQAYQLQLDLVTQAMTKVGATSEQIARAQTKVQDQFQVSWTAIGSSIASTAGQLSSLTGTFGKENKAMGIASKAFGLAQVAINTAVAITKAMTLPPPANVAAMALAAATGAAQAAVIAAQKFATGGSFTVGGTGGIDTQMVSFMATPGEMVDVRKPGTSGPASEITIRGLSGRDMFTGDMLRDLVDGLNAAHSDGYRLKFAS